MSTAINTIEKPRLSVKVQSLAALAAIIGAVAVPQDFSEMQKFRLSEKLSYRRFLDVQSAQLQLLQLFIF